MNSNHIDNLISKRKEELKCYQNMVKQLKDEIKRLEEMKKNGNHSNN